jgi:hypothetical protein
MEHFWNILVSLGWALLVMPFLGMAKLCDEGEAELGDLALKKATQYDNLYLGLYTSPTSEPGEDNTLTSLTEPAAGGYARIALGYADWTKSGSIFTNTQKTFNCSGSAWGNVYGYFICTVVSGTVGKLWAVEQFSDGPYNVPDGGAVKVTPKMTFS